MKEGGKDAEGVRPVWKALESNQEQNIDEAVWLRLPELSEFLPQTSSRAEINDSGLLGWWEREEKSAAACLQSVNTLLPMEEDYWVFLFLFLYLQAPDQNNDFGTGI